MPPQFRFSKNNASILPGLSLVQDSFKTRFSEHGRLIEFQPADSHNGFVIEASGDSLLIRYHRPSQAYRALGQVLSGAPLEGGKTLSQTCFLESVGVMLDVSRNGVFRVERIEELFLQFALAGIDSVQLYMEDSYLLPGEPYFGYGRGAYSESELRQIDDRGHAFGIEVVPCIQTLGHLEQILQWPAYHNLQDVRGVLMVGLEETHRLIAKMLDVVSACFRTRRIHVGMDEAHGVGSGNYLRENGFRRPFDVLNEHLAVVTRLCEDRGLEPMMWSDMFFRIGSKTHDYYDPQAVIPEEVIARVPKGVELVYWDYYHADVRFYEDWIDRHRAMGKEPIYAAGGWTWGRFWAYWPRLQETIGAGMEAARRKGLKESFVTFWGDDGCECHPFSMLGAILYFAETAYFEAVDFAELERLFTLFSPEVTLADCQLAAELDGIPEIQDAVESESNFSKWILWHDPVLGFLNPHIPAGVIEHYRELAEKLGNRSGAPTVLDFPRTIAQTLSEKIRLHLEVRSACQSRDFDKLRELRSEVLPATIEGLNKVWVLHRNVWRHWYKPFGWEVIESRYATIIARLNSLGSIVQDCIDNPGAHVEEFTLSPNPVLPTEQASKCYFSYGRITTPSVLK